MLQKNLFGHKAFYPLYATLSGIFMVLITMGVRCESRHGIRPVDPSTTILDDSFPYNLERPSLKIVLADEALREISGLGFTSSPGILAAIADEKGEVFLLDLQQNGAIKQRISFVDKGDFEGVEMVGDTIYAIKSNAKIFEIIDWKSEATPKVNIYENPFSEEHDFEGLCYDPDTHSLLMSAKEDPETNTVRNIWSFDLKSKKRSDQPVFSIHPDEIDQIVPLVEEDKGRHFSTSGIAFHPVSGDLYILSSALKRLVVLNPKTGHIRYAVRLNKEVLLQPEGIAFDPQGNLYISSEGKKQEGYILKFEKK